ncbi:DUF3800 domain-containing protein [Candidatus Saccharibacteria bacterium]|nr:DUF3800 domain-containing protein [Candidatus Saccharibacteria bacterium]
MAHKKQLIFIDDSGDPGFKSVSSVNFVMACAVFIDPKMATKLNADITNYRRSLNWQDKHEFKFNKTPKTIIKDFLHLANKYDFQIYGVYLDKTKYLGLLQIVDSGELYNWAIKELLESIPLKEASVNLDGRASRTYRLRVAAYLRHSLNGPNSYKIKKVNSKDSKEDNLIQLADVVAGSINRSLQNDKTDSLDYIKIIESKIVSLKQLSIDE